MKLFQYQNMIKMLSKKLFGKKLCCIFWSTPSVYFIDTEAFNTYRNMSIGHESPTQCDMNMARAYASDNKFNYGV